MKKLILFLPALAIMASCVGNGNSGARPAPDGAGNVNAPDREEIYTGIMPAADADGIRYMLRLEFDGDHNFTKGDYDLYETYLTSDTTSSGNAVDGKTFRSEGDFIVETGFPGNPNGRYLKLVPDDKNGQSLYFIVDSDSTITLTDSSLKPAESTLNYTLTRK